MVSSKEILVHDGYLRARFSILLSFVLTCGNERGAGGEHGVAQGSQHVVLLISVVLYNQCLLIGR